MKLAHGEPQKHAAQADAFVPDLAVNSVFLAQIAATAMRAARLLVAVEIVNEGARPVVLAVVYASRFSVTSKRRSAALGQSLESGHPRWSCCWLVREDGRY